MANFYYTDRDNIESAKKSARNAEDKAGEAVELIKALSEQIGTLGRELTGRIDTLEEAMFDPKSEAAEKLRRKHGAGPKKLNFK